MAMRNSEPSPQPAGQLDQPVAHIDRRDSHDPRIDGDRLPAAEWAASTTWSSSSAA